MLAIRMQRTGRKGHAQFRVIVQDAHRHPSSGNIVALLGSYNPHTKTTTVDKEKASLFLQNGAQPSDRVARLLKSEGVKLPKWVELEGKKKGAIRNPEKLRKNRPAGAEAPPTKEEKAAEAAQEAEAAKAENLADQPHPEQEQPASPVEAEQTSETEETVAEARPEAVEEPAAEPEVAEAAETPDAEAPTAEPEVVDKPEVPGDAA